MTKDPRVYLAQILECTRRITTYTAKGKDQFFSEPVIQDAVLRNFELIGEAAKRQSVSQTRTGKPIPPFRGVDWRHFVTSSSISMIPLISLKSGASLTASSAHCSRPSNGSCLP